MAAQRCLGTLELTDVPPSEKISGLNRVGAWFAAGAFVLALAVVAHFLSLWKSHYLLASAGVVLITAGVVVAANQRNVDVKSSHRAHYTVGYVTLGWLWAQAVFGYILTQVDLETKIKYGWTHRVSAIVLFGLLAYLFFTVALEQVPFANMKHIDDWAVTTAVLIGVYLLLAGVVAYRLPARLQSSGALRVPSFADLERLL